MAKGTSATNGGCPKFDLSDSSDVDVVVDEDGMEEKYEVPEPLSDARPEGSLILGNLSDGSRATILTPVASMIQIMPRREEGCGGSNAYIFFDVFRGVKMPFQFEIYG